MNAFDHDRAQATSVEQRARDLGLFSRERRHQRFDRVVPFAQEQVEFLADFEPRGQAFGKTLLSALCMGRAVGIFPYAPAAGNLGRLLHLSGRAQEAVPLLHEALKYNPLDRSCWTSLVVSLTVLGDLDSAWNEAQRAVGRGVELDPGLLEEIRRLRSETVEGEP